MHVGYCCWKERVRVVINRYHGTLHNIRNDGFSNGYSRATRCIQAYNLYARFIII